MITASRELLKESRKDITVFEIDGRLMKQECCFIRVMGKQGIDSFFLKTGRTRFHCNQ